MASTLFQEQGICGPPLVTANGTSPGLSNLVNPLQGTDSHHGFSTGNTLPLVSLPHGMVSWTPQTDEGRWIFDARAPKLQAFRATRQPSPWMADYGQFMVMATSGDRAPLGYDDTSSAYRKEETRSHPHYFRTFLQRHGIEAECTPTQRGGAFRFTFKQGGQAWIAFKLGQGDTLRVDRIRSRIHGTSTAHNGGVPANFGCHFVAEIGAEILDFGRADPADPSWLWLKVKRPASRQVIVRIGTSFISDDQAALNMHRELGRRPFASLVTAAQRTWDTRLAVIEIDDATDAQCRTFYSCLYRCFLFPRIWHEIDAQGNQVHFSPYSGRVHPGPLYTDIGFWDVHRTLLPLLSLLAPDLLGEMIEGWVNAYREGGWLPSWASPGYRVCMVGSHSTAVIADAYAKGIRNFDVAGAYTAMRQDAMVDPPSEAVGRTGIGDYIRLGFVPADLHAHSVPRTTDYAHCDFAVGSLARALGKDEDARAFTARALNYRHVFDRRSGFLRGRNADGTWRAPFDAFDWSRDYIEGSAWQHTWAVPHDAAGLIRLMGGARAFVAKLDRMLALPPRFSTGGYATEIHEMTEMAAAGFGQYAHSNQPVHHVLYLYTSAGRPDRTQHWVRRIVDEAYSPDRFPGDEDNGEMSAWYVLSTLGLYPLTVGHPAYVLGAPRFRQARIRMPDGGSFKLEADGDAQTQPYVRSIELNGRPHCSLELAHAEVRSGARLRFHLTERASIAAQRGRLARPYSLSLC